ncbi:unnamed protein product [Adineta ricciae]|uniref:Uncharacterized protein n=1 Tax=Adineta ricciae TaxID=249248 RepID=A0A813QID9_ADIRI|nr:unnamed protein product [Adineta ricciae]CAF1033114.1 unnamed protein product [Adineta ricciae]
MTKNKAEKSTMAFKLDKTRNIDIHQTNNHQDLYDLFTDYKLIAPYEIPASSIGLLSILTNQHINDVSFSKLYQSSLKIGWEKVLTQDRQKLKPNEISVSKCLVINRLLHEYLQNPQIFVQRTHKLYNEVKARMTTNFPSWTSQDLFQEVRRWRDFQCRRRLFYFNHEELVQLPGLLMLQKAATNWCHCLTNYYRENKNLWQTDGRPRCSEHFQHSFIIVAQPTGSEGAAATQYIKSSSGHFARMNTRIVCLLDPVILQNLITLSDIDVTLYPLLREGNDKKEKQMSIKWEVRKVMDAEGNSVPLLCAEFHTLKLGKNDSDSKRLSLNSTLCQLEFRFKVKAIDLDFEENIVLTSQPFGICSHAQYFPKFVAQIFLYEMKQILKDQRLHTDPNIITDFVRRYYIRTTGFELAGHTNQYICKVFTRAIGDMKNTSSVNTLDHAFEDILTKIISQIDYLVLHPVLLLLYDDGLFLGICDSLDFDRSLEGTREQPQLLLRFNTLVKHQWNSNAVMRCIIHDGELRRASFDSKSFVNELCRLICESVNQKTKQALVRSTISPRYFKNFQWYFHDELYRLNKMSPPNSDAYDPLLPILWMTMRKNDDQHTSDRHLLLNERLPRKKRSRSDSFPTIDSVTSENLPIPVNIVLHINSPQRQSSYSTSDKSSKTTEQIQSTTDSQDVKKKCQWLIEMPADINISPDVVFRYLSEKFSTMINNQNETIPSTYFIQPEPPILSIADLKYLHSSQRITSPTEQSPDGSNSSSELSKMDLQARSDDSVESIKIKDEPYDFDYETVSSRIIVP